jgi:deoxyribose-phosphate aldolase
LPSTIKIKASGGIKTKQQAVDLLKAGADRLGTSAGPSLI